MSFSLPFILLALFFCYGCGVKAKPLSPPETAVQSYVNSFLDKDKETEVKPAVPAK